MESSGRNKGFVVLRDDGDPAFGGYRTRSVPLNKQLTGNIAISSSKVRPGVLVAPHIHTNEDEVWHIVEGKAMVMLGEEIFEAPEGSTVWRPRDQYHASWVPHDQEYARILTVLSPGGWEQATTEYNAGRAGQPFDEVAFKAMAEENGVYWDFDWGRALAKELGLRLMGQRD